MWTCPADDGSQSEGDLAQLPLPAAGHPGDADELTGRHGQADVLQGEVSLVALGIDVVQAQRRFAIGHRDARRPAGQVGHALAHHGLDELAIGVVVGIDVLQDRTSATQHRGAVGDRSYLVELVRHDEDAEALVAQVVDDAEQGGDLLRREDTRRLVEDHELGSRHEDLEDLDALPFADREVPDLCLRVDGETVPFALLSDALAERAQLERDAAGDREGDVLRDGERGHEPQVLEHHADAEPPRFRGAVDDRLMALDDQLAVIGVIDAVDHLEQGALAGTVLADQSVHLARPHLEAHGGVGVNLTEVLGESQHCEQWSPRSDRLLVHGSRLSVFTAAQGALAHG